MRNPSIRLTRHLRRMLLVASPLALVLGLSSGAQATTYAFAFSDTSAVLQAYGTLTTANGYVYAGDSASVIDVLGPMP